MKTGGWIYFVASSDTTSLRWAMRMVFWMLVATILILVTSFWAVHRMTRPKESDWMSARLHCRKKDHGNCEMQRGPSI